MIVKHAKTLLFLKIYGTKIEIHLLEECEVAFGKLLLLLLQQKPKRIFIINLSNCYKIALM